ncbi:hypothetical protein BD626DRAFT_492614 [Schizophyllum amplum]|uniref:Uncharacterized protein n=1 Tax=Schizophyllum amplum TaxID=97359 RepID=A0A550CG23_9AGAR|nr:hypothetical protein BD626DRAFT_492614 [Auriculariopsis ampla]
MNNGKSRPLSLLSRQHRLQTLSYGSWQIVYRCEPGTWLWIQMSRLQSIVGDTLSLFSSGCSCSTSTVWLSVRFVQDIRLVCSVPECRDSIVGASCSGARQLWRFLLLCGAVPVHFHHHMQGRRAYIAGREITENVQRRRACRRWECSAVLPSYQYPRENSVAVALPTALQIQLESGPDRQEEKRILGRYVAPGALAVNMCLLATERPSDVQSHPALTSTPQVRFSSLAAAPAAPVPEAQSSGVPLYRLLDYPCAAFFVDFLWDEHKFARALSHPAWDAVMSTTTASSFRLWISLSRGRFMEVSLPSRPLTGRVIVTAARRHLHQRITSVSRPVPDAQEVVNLRAPRRANARERLEIDRLGAKTLFGGIQATAEGIVLHLASNA